MLIVGYAIGTGAGRLIRTIADYVGFAVLAGVGVFIVKESFGSGNQHSSIGEMK